MTESTPFTLAFMVDSERLEICEVKLSSLIDHPQWPPGVLISGNCSYAAANGGRCTHAEKAAEEYTKNGNNYAILFDSGEEALDPNPATVREQLLHRGIHRAV